jgi:hypothetical protein
MYRGKNLRDRDLAQIEDYRYGTKTCTVYRYISRDINMVERTEKKYKIKEY